MADYIDSMDPQELPPPYRFPGVNMTAFVVDLGLEHGLPGLSRWCDRFLRVDPNAHYRPLAPIGYLCVLDYPKMYCDAPGFEQWGFVPQKEVFFTFPTLRMGKAIGNIYLPTQLSWAFPFISVNNPTSATTGRMVLGYQKLFGDIKIDTESDGSMEATVRLPTFLTQGHDVEQKYEPIVSVRTGPLNGAAEKVDQHFPWNWMGQDRAMDYVENGAINLLSNVVPGLLEVVNLKQMRGAEQPKEAVYQGLVQTRMKFSNLSAPTFYQDPAFKIYPNASMDCGINGGELAKLADDDYRPAMAAFSFKADMFLDEVRDVYVAPPPAATPTGGLIGNWLGFWGPMLNNMRNLLFPFG